MNYTLNQWQEDFYSKMKSLSVLCAHRRFGKTFLSVYALAKAAWERDEPDGVFVYVTFSCAAATNAWRLFAQMFETVTGVKKSNAARRITLPNGSEIWVLTASAVELAVDRDLVLNGAALDEMPLFPSIRPSVYDKLLRADWVLCTGTGGILNGPFAKLYRKADASADGHAQRFSAKDTGFDESYSEYTGEGKHADS